MSGTEASPDRAAPPPRRFLRKAIRPRVSLRVRAMATATVSLAAILLVDAWARQRAMEQAGRTALTERASLLATVEAAALSVPLWNLDQDQLDAALDAVAEDPDFAAAALLLPDGSVLGARSRAGAASLEHIDVSRAIGFSDHGRMRTLGTLRISLVTSRLHQALLAELRAQGLALFTLLGAVMMAVLSALRQLTRPLDKLTYALGRLADGDLETPLPWLDRVDEVGAMARALGVFRDTARRLVRAEGQYKAVFDNAALGIFSAAETGEITSVNAALLAITGFDDFETAKAALDDGRLFVSNTRRDELTGLWQMRAGYSGEVAEFRRADGSPVWVSANVRAARDEAGRVLGFVGTLEDITFRLRRQSEERLRVRAALQSASDAIIIADEHGEPLFANPAFVAAFGYTEAEIAAAGGLPGLVTDAPARRMLLQALEGAGAWQGEAETRVRDGTLVPMLIRASPIRDEAGATVGSVVICTDLTRRRVDEARIRHLAHHDTLTNLPNRILFGDRLNGALEQLAGGTGQDGVALLCLDLDRFKDVNDALGHAAGDALLCAVASRLTACLAACDLVARVGGDEFLVLQTLRPGGQTPQSLAARLIAELSHPYIIGARQVSVGVSIGIALAPVHAIDPGQLLRYGDMALYDAKARGRGQACLFTPELETVLRQRSDLERDLREAVADGALHLHYQPQYALGRGTILGAEALLRWHHPVRGHVSPAEFVPMAESCGLITVLGAWVLRAACREAAGWPGSLSVAVNLSPVQFRTTDLVAFVAGVLAETGLEPARLELEITEGVLLGDSPDVMETLAGLKALGVRIALDDFGTGYSSLSYLQRMPIDKLKIDQSFTRVLGTDPAARPLVRSIIGIARDLGIVSLAEGVETELQAEMLREEGCVEVQGYLFGRPMPGEAFAELVGGELLAELA